MEIRALVDVLDHPHLAEEHLHGWRLSSPAQGREILLDLADAGLTLDLLAELCRQLGKHLPRLPDPDAALDGLRRFLFAMRSPLGLAALLERDPSAMPQLLNALALAPQWADLLVDDPDAFDLLRQAAGQAVEKTALAADIVAEVTAFHDERQIVAALGRIRRRHLLRIAYSEAVAQMPLDNVLAQLSDLAEALVEAALAAALRRAAEQRPAARRALAPARVVVIALGALGAREIDYALPLELLAAYDAAGAEAASLAAVHEHFERAVKLMARWLAEAAEPQAGDVQLATLPDSPLAASAHAADDVVFGFDSFGRTWHRQQLLKARPVAGDLELGRAIVGRLQPWLYRRYLNRADETGIKALKRRIVLEATLHQDDWRDVRLARGGLRDIRAAVEFLQLLSGGDQPAVREASVLGALAGLAQAKVLTADELETLSSTFQFLRRLEHRLQITLGPGQTELPADEEQMARLAAAIGAAPGAVELTAALRSRLEASWQTLRKLLASAFTEEPPVSREVELLLAPNPPAEEVRAALAPFGFHDPQQALQSLDQLAREQVPFLSTRRCRHLLATILPQLLCAVAATPQPDRTLDSLVRVSDSLGGKGVLWDLFRFHPPSLALYVKLCAASPYLSGILTTNPGMIDELVDSLQLDRLPSSAELSATLAEMMRGAAGRPFGSVSDNTLPVLHDFKNAEHLRIGVRDILGKEQIDRTHAALAAVAETCLVHVADVETARLVEKHGQPTIGPGPDEGQPCRFAIVGLGKLGGREPNYHSQLDLLFLYEADGVTQPVRSRRIERTANNHFFTQLAQRITKTLGQHTPKGRLYAVDTLLRPIGIGGALALPLQELKQHFTSGAAPLWQWQALCQARPVVGEPAFADTVAALLRQLLTERPWSDDDVVRLRRGRLDQEQGAAPDNLKRAAGGTLDVEFLVQMLQLKYAAEKPGILTTNTAEGLRALAAAKVLDRQRAEQLDHHYRFLRQVESALRLREATRRHDLPTDPLELSQLALLLGHSNPDRLREQCLETMAENRGIFDELTKAPQSEAPAREPNA